MSAAGGAVAGAIAAVIAAAAATRGVSDDASLRFLALGDSYTIGEGVPASARWPMQLAAALRDEGIAIDDPRVIATTGWTTDELSAAMDADEPIPTYDLVTLLIGVNNQYRGRSADDYAHEFERLLQRAIRLADGRAQRVLVLAIPDWGVTPFAAQSGRDVTAIARDLDAYNTRAKQLCQTYDVAFVDIAPISRRHGGEPAMLTEDGLHPSATMYTEWVRLALPVARHALQR